ncbi:MAG: GNAT family N-acetyltransferase [Hyphomicrobiaceae bacterium]|nr:GNAT family N-acetyltransferase [Hyphomicrobiaceae bacterium]
MGGGAGDEGVRLRPATRADWPLIRSWLARPDIQRWWGPQASAEAEVLMALDSAHAICRIIDAGGTPVGYAHAVDTTLWGEALPDDLAPGTWDLDVFIAARSHRGRGFGEAALRLIKEEVFSTTLAVAVCVFAAIENEAVVRAYEKAGFQWRRVWHDPVLGPEWFMVAERPAR